MKKLNDVLGSLLFLICFAVVFGCNKQEDSGVPNPELPPDKPVDKQADKDPELPPDKPVDKQADKDPELPPDKPVDKQADKDGELFEKIVGTWRVKIKDYEWTIIYQEDGSFIGHQKQLSTLGSIALGVRDSIGTWAVRDGKLIQKTIASDVPWQAKYVGVEHASEILAITNLTLVVEEDGKEFALSRVKEE